MSYGLSNTITNFNIQENKSYCSSNATNSFTISNSFCYTSTGTGNVVYLNCFLSSFDNNITNLSGFFIGGKLSATRLC